MITDSDWAFHPRSTHPHWNESAWWGFHIPERSINGWVMVNHRPNMNYTIAGAGLWDLSGSEVYDCLYHGWNDPLPLPGGSEMFDFRLMNGFEVKTIDPMKSVRILFSDDDLELDLTWTAFMEPRASGLPSGADEFGNGHYEQGGRMRGTLVAYGEELQIDCWSNRDHSWGPRRFFKNPRGDFPWAVASEKSAFQVLAVADEHPDTDPVIDRACSVVTGWYIKDGVISDFVSGKRNVSRRGWDGRPELITIDAVDKLGRELRAEGTPMNWLRWTGYANLYQWWMLTDWRFDGNQGYGDAIEWLPAYAARRFIRSQTQQH